MSTLTHPAAAVQSIRHRAPRGGVTIAGRFYRGGCFCPPFDPDNPRGLAVVEIKGADYLVEPIAAGECGCPAAVRLTKRAGGASYDVVRRHDGLVECDCPDYEFRHRGTAGQCKHSRAAVVHGLLIPPAPAPAAELAPEVPAENPRDGWPDWVDADRWTVVEEGPAPTWDAPRFEPEDIAAAYEAGYQLGLAGEYPRPPAHYSPREACHFGCGRLAGFIASPDGRAWRADMDAHRDRAFAEYDANRDAEPREWDGYPAGYCS